MPRAILCILVGAFLLPGCANSGASVTLVIGDQVIRIRADTRVPAALVEEAGFTIDPGDKVLNRGMVVDATIPLPDQTPVYLQILHAVEVDVNGNLTKTAAGTVGELMYELGYQLSESDYVEPGVQIPIKPGLVVRLVPSEQLTVRLVGGTRTLRSAPSTSTGALSEAGYAPIGLDSTSPSGDTGWPADHALQLTRVSEEVQLVQEPVRFETRTMDSADLALGTEQIVQPGQTGLAVTRTRKRYENGTQVSARTEARVTLRPPQDRVVARGTKIVEVTTTVEGQVITYWRALQMYATVYSPCNSGTGSCSSGTASGLPAGKGVVAVDPALYAVLNGQRLFIPGYGFATIGDVGGGYIVEQNLGISRYRWIDLGFDDNNLQDMTGWITVYFLAPVPAAIPDVLK